MNSKYNPDYCWASLGIQSYVEKIVAIRSQQEFFKICSGISEELGTSFFSYGVMWSDSFHDTQYSILSNFEPGWVEEYKHNAYQLIDPRIKQCLTHSIPVFWNTRGSYVQKLSHKPRTMMDKAHNYGIRAGVTVPLHNPQNISGVFGVGFDSNLYEPESSQAHLECITPYLSYLGSHLHQSMIKMLGLYDVLNPDPLTLREKDCLSWAADGLTGYEIASRLYISESTVKFHFRNILKKLEVRNTSQAIAVAILKGYVKPTMKN